MHPAPAMRGQSIRIIFSFTVRTGPSVIREPTIYQRNIYKLLTVDPARSISGYFSNAVYPLSGNCNWEFSIICVGQDHLECHVELNHPVGSTRTKLLVALQSISTGDPQCTCKIEQGSSRHRYRRRKRSSATSQTSICPSACPSCRLEVKAMRKIMAGFAILGTLALGTMAPASAHSLAVSPPFMQSHPVQQVDWDNCGPRCQEHRREAREREWQRQRWAQHRHSEEHHGWQDGRQSAPQSYDHQHRY